MNKANSLRQQILNLQTSEPNLSAKQIAERIGCKLQAIYNVRYQEARKREAARRAKRASATKPVEQKIEKKVEQKPVPPKHDDVGMVIEILRRENAYLRSLVDFYSQRHGVAI